MKLFDDMTPIEKTEYIRMLEAVRHEAQAFLDGFMHLKPTEQSMLDRLKIAIAALESVEK